MAPIKRTTRSPKKPSRRGKVITLSMRPKIIRATKPATKVKMKSASKASINGNDPMEVLFFASTKGEFGFLSQWAVTPFTSPDGTKYRSAEQYMMHQKAIVFEDEASAEKILASNVQTTIKALGRKIANFDDDIWSMYREKIVMDGTYLKFTQSDKKIAKESLKEKLLQTGERQLVEAAPWDKVWGIGFSAAEAPDHEEEWGLNLLGRALMSVRTIIRNGESWVVG
ncbi:hypothetical protein VTL71DRAFT_6002 [Oculimacula yallundae]|uniref:NADAR domain-containing protein n=1 Tax=Oculimacula yallundae TaxID=86028 RepID=A0ABR4BZ85_9HELO